MSYVRLANERQQYSIDRLLVLSYYYSTRPVAINALKNDLTHFNLAKNKRSKVEVACIPRRVPFILICHLCYPVSLGVANPNWYK